MGRQHAVLVAAITMVLSLLSAAPAWAAPPQRADLLPTKARLDAAAERAPDAVGVWYVDEASGAVVVETTDAAAAAEFVASSGANRGPVVVRGVAGQPRPTYNLVGGQPITAPGAVRCKIGFSARSGATTYVITSGHCTAASPGPWSGYNGVVIGPTAGSSYPGDDYGLVRVTNPEWVGTSQVQGTSSVLGATAAPVGASVCMSGSTTGYRCGTVQARNATVNYGGGNIVYGLTRTSLCSEPGDSGTPIVAGRQAQGIVSGGSGNCTSGGTTYFQPVGEVLSTYGLTLITG